MVLTAIFNISVISWQSALLVKETGIPGETNRSVTSHQQPLSHNVVLKYTSSEWDSNYKKVKLIHIPLR